MTTFNTPRRNDAPQDFSRLSCEVVVLDDLQRGHSASYRVTCTDTETGRTVGRAVLPAGPDGGPPRVTLEDLAGLVGGYRLASVFVEIEAEQLARQTGRVSDLLRRRDRSWLRRARHLVPYESDLESDYLRSFA